MKMIRLFLLFGIFTICHTVFAQNLMVIHQGNGTKLQIPLESIDSVRFATVPPPIRQKIFQNNGNILSLSVADIDSINYIIPNAQALAGVSTQAVTVLSSSSAYGGGLVSSNGGSAVTQRGLCWSTSTNPTLANNFTVDGAGTGSFGSTMAPLQAATTYYVRAYAVNSEGTAYGNAVVFTTSNPSVSGLLATIATANVLYTSGLTANCGGNITADGGLAVTARGVCWAAGTTPTINNNHTVDGAGAGSFTSTLTNLLPNTTYFVRAYATNDAGTAYGVSYAFTTHNLPTLTTNLVSGITATTAVSGGNISSDGGGSITARGVCWSTSPNPTIALSTKTNDGTGTGSFTSNLSSLSPNTMYYVRAYATNSAGSAYGNEFLLTTASLNLPILTTNEVTSITVNAAVSGGIIISSGGSYILAKGVCWDTSQNPNIQTCSSTFDGSDSSSFVSTLYGLTPGTTYFLRAYAKNGDGVAYGNQLSFVTNEPTLPTLTTQPALFISNRRSFCRGEISNDGGGSILARGLCWSTNPNPTINLATKTINGTGIGYFFSHINGLNPNTTYYIRAYATNVAGTAYGNQISITTLNSMFTPGAGVTDIDGNNYNSIILNGQEWMKENLKVSKYRNGNSIPTGLTDSQWNSTTSGAYSMYNNDSTNNILFGKLYNWYTVVDSRRLCPIGWHVPSDSEWSQLSFFLGGDSLAGGEMKMVSSLWTSPNIGATNESGFSALPGGQRLGGYNSLGYYGTWWSTDGYLQSSSDLAYGRQVSNSSELLTGGSWFTLNYVSRKFGKSVRCLKD